MAIRMTAILRIITSIALIAMCGNALAALPDETAKTQRGEANTAQLASKDKVKDSEPAADKRSAKTGRRLTLQQKRIFVLGLAEKENK